MNDRDGADPSIENGSSPVTSHDFFDLKEPLRPQRDNDSRTKLNSSLITFRSVFETLVSVFQTIYVNRWLLLGTAGSWFILDVIFYANGLFSGQVNNRLLLCILYRRNPFSAILSKHPYISTSS